MPSCSVPGCNNRSEKDRVRGVSFHILPVKKPQWLDQIRRDKRFGLPEPKYVYVCSEHFTQDCFETEYRFQLLGGNTHIRSLKTGSVPTIFKWEAPVKVQRSCTRAKGGMLKVKISSIRFSRIFSSAVK